MEKLGQNSNHILTNWTEIIYKNANFLKIFLFCGSKKFQNWLTKQSISLINLKIYILTLKVERMLFMTI